MSDDSRLLVNAFYDLDYETDYPTARNGETETTQEEQTKEAEEKDGRNGRNRSKRKKRKKRKQKNLIMK